MLWVKTILSFTFNRAIWNANEKMFWNSMFSSADARGPMASGEAEQGREVVQLQMILRDCSTSYFALIFYQGIKHGYVNICVSVS